ncbi:MAG: hypothetical protein ACPIOQ_28555, partial [Promethearchaeia archaeon]
RRIRVCGEYTTGGACVACCWVRHMSGCVILTPTHCATSDRMSRMRDSLFRREVNWHSILLPLCEELCVPAYMNW